MTDNPEGSLAEFFNKIDAWIDSACFITPKVPKELVESILNLSNDDIHELSSEELMQRAYQLYGHIETLQQAYNKEKAILEFCEESIWRIIAPVFNNYGDGYTKWEFKYNAAVRENPLAQKINSLKNATRARLTSMEHRIEHTKKRSDILFEIARRRKNEHYS